MALRLAAARLLLTSVASTSALRFTARPLLRSALASSSASPLIAAVPARSSSGVRAAADSPSLEEQIKDTVASSKVVVYSKSWCPFCDRTKSLFDKLGVEYKAIELDELAEGDEIQTALLGLTQQRTVPNVFIGGQHLGGNDDTQKAAADGRLQEMLSK